MAMGSSFHPDPTGHPDPSGDGHRAWASWPWLWLIPLVAILVTGSLFLVNRLSAPLVADQADLLNDNEERRIAEFHHFLLADHDLDYRIVIDRDLEDINTFAADYFRDHSVGGLSDTGRGLLLVLDAGTNQVRLEVSRALEPVYTDAFAAYVEHRQMTEFFAANRIADGILATTELLIQRATNSAAGLDPSTEGWTARSGGGGARVDARIGEGGEDRRTDGIAVDGSASPQDVLTLYKTAMDNRNNNPDLDIYSRETRKMLAQRVMTPAQMDNVARSLRECKVDKTFRQDGRAVLRFPIAERTCPPYFFRKEDGQWRLDFTVMIDAIRFGRNNQWRLEPGYTGPYTFAFLDLRFDRNGYPLAR